MNESAQPTWINRCGRLFLGMLAGNGVGAILCGLVWWLNSRSREAGDVITIPSLFLIPIAIGLGLESARPGDWAHAPALLDLQFAGLRRGDGPVSRGDYLRDYFVATALRWRPGRNVTRSSSLSPGSHVPASLAWPHPGRSGARRANVARPPPIRGHGRAFH